MKPHSQAHTPHSVPAEYWPIDCMIGGYIPCELRDFNKQYDGQYKGGRSPHSQCKTAESTDPAWLSILVVAVLLLISGLSFMAGVAKLTDAWTVEASRTIKAVSNPIQ